MIRNIHSSAFDISKSIESHINTNLDKVSEHYDRITRADIHLKKDGFNYVAEINLHVPNKGEVVINQAHTDMYHAITEATNKILIKLKKVTGKEKSRLHKKIEIQDAED